VNGRLSSALAVARGIVPRAILCAVLRAVLLTVLPAARTPVLPTVLLSALLSALSTAPARSDNASCGVAGAYSLRARGVEAPAWNPATLAWSPALDLRMAAVDGGAHNNAFSLRDYRRWNGAILDEQDQEAILASIPGSVLRGGFAAGAEGPGAAWRGWALTTVGCAAGSVAVPKEFGRLVFYGNDPEQSYDLGGTRGEGTAWSELRLSHGRALATTQIGGRPVAVVGGFTLKWIRGWAQAQVIRAEGSLVTNMDGITGAEELTGRSATGGNGYACDLGVAARTGGWRLGLTLTNPASHLSWTRRPEEHTQRAWVDSLALDDLEEDEQTDLVSTDDTTRAIASFSTALPAEIAVAAAHRWRDFDWEADLRQGFSTRPGTSTTPRLALGVSRRPWRFFEGRAGLAVGGADGPVLALGAGFALWKLRCDLGIASTHGINFTSPRGVEAGVSLGLSWDKAGD
jgi:hypothetical protein